MLIGITRVRNESLIIADTIEHYLECCNRIVLYDDCSTDETVAIARAVGGRYVDIIRGDVWRSDRPAEETRHRHLVLQRALALGAKWCLCFDADERLVGELPELNGDGIRFRLFDGYLTKERQQHYTGGDLAALPRVWGPEYRDILMLFCADKARYAGLDRREPILRGKISLGNVMVKHYGKCLSIEHWEETCAYYATHFPEPYRSKWEARKGRALHSISDFGRGLYTWNELMQHQADWCRL
jgi:glycosyltransferase involved in cell wall biosynthesis